ncbi:MAG: hypothetical protein ACD_79C00304G0005 [uncultured bacterium]|nr:MAG: hypothetical protein ACD_79C00304G0005 [uncultured bacterium]
MIKINKVDSNNPDLTVLKEGGRILKEGGVVVFPTETVYGIGANSKIESAIDRIYKIKNRPKDKPFSYHLHSLEFFYDFAGKGIDEKQKKWFNKLIPNPVTLVYYDTLLKTKIGVRFPENKVAKLLLKEASCPVVATSANFSGEISPESVDVMDEKFLTCVDFIIDSGKTENKTDSTVIDISGVKPIILRQGAYKLCD